MKCPAPLLAVLLLAGCATPKDEPIVPFTPEQNKNLYAKARPPQTFGLTVYNSDAGPVFAGAGRLHQGDTAVRSFLGPDDSTAPLIGIHGRGDFDLPALIDTTSRNSWLTAKTGLQMGITLLAGPAPLQATAQHVYDEIGGGAGLVQKVKLDQLHMENVVFYLRSASGPLGPLARWVKDPAPLAVLGTSFLRAYSYVQLDYPNRTAFFSATARLAAPGELTLVARLPLKEVLGALAVEGTLDGQPTTFLLDTAGDFELVMHEPANATVRRLSIGDLVFPPEVQVVSSMDQGLGPIVYPRIGRQLLSRFKVSFDFRNKLVYFERPASVSLRE